MTTTIPYDLDVAAQPADPDAPDVSGPAATSSSTLSSSRPSQGTGGERTSSGARPGGGGGGGGGNRDGGGSDSEDDDAAPDYRLLGKLLGGQQQQQQQGQGSSSSSATARHQALPDGFSVASTEKSKFGPGQGIIPKRGEKDFEPTGFRGQRNALEDSRAAMFAAIGSERHPSKSLSVATWDPILQRAIVHSSKGILFQTMGLTNRLPQHDEPPAKIDANGVHWPRIVSRIELTPEETLFLLERGALDCRVRLPRHTPEAERQRKGEYTLAEDEDEPLDVQRAYSLLLGADGCTKEAYGVYAYLRRLGYVVHRASVIDQIRARAAEKAKADREAGGAEADDEEVQTEGIVADPDRPLRLVTIWDILLYVPRRLFQLGGDAIRWMGSWTRAIAAWLARIVGRVVGGLSASASFFSRSTGLGSSGLKRGPSAPGGLLGIGGSTFADFDSAFSKLQIVPSGHDLPLPSAPSSTAARDEVAPSLSRQPAPPPFDIFFYAWRPATQFRKTYPPPAEFRIAICDARRQRMIPSMMQFASLFGAVPMPGMEALDEEDAARAAEQVKRNNASYGRAQSTKVRTPRRGGGPGQAGARGGGPRAEGASSSSAAEAQGVRGYVLRALLRVRYVLELLAARLLAHLPPGCVPTDLLRGLGASKRPFHHKRPLGPNPFPVLKSGRRNVVVAVVDQGTTSLLRFGEAEFARWRLAGGDPAAS
ncbi:tRNA-splicing endonuclease subunit sen54 [Tilletia horrida]|nr:tRNA-splicing endonuclease subunit sen54 [Tilletia horrida]